MGRSLVIVESPAKAKTINKYLGKDFIVKSSYGHVRDLPTGGDEEDPAERLAKANEARKVAKAAGKTVAKATPAEKASKQKTALIRRMGVDPEHGWKAQYEIIPDKLKVVAELRALAKDADAIYLASDLDREGESIAWHLREVIGGEAKRFKRVVFNEITKKAITAAFEQPGTVNEDRVNAQQARRFLDRVVGFMASPVLWNKVARGLSAGRVQSVAVRLIVEREQAIRAFTPEEYWELHADLATPAALRAKVVRFKGGKFEPQDGVTAKAALAALDKAAYRVSARDDKPTRSFPSAPFKTSTLQAAASTRLGFSVKKTMTVAQRLYEAGHITYMRTDSVNLSQDALTAVRELITSSFGAKYLPEKPIFYKGKENAQEAHEAIRPTDGAVLASQLDVEDDARRLYDLIWRQFVACQMPPAEFDTTRITIAAGDYELTANGRVLRFDGFQKVQPPAKSDEPELPSLVQGAVLKLVKLDPTQHFTKPPPRYSEAALVKELEERGIGRPSTYAAIISTIQDRGYVKLENRRFYAQKIGDIVTSRLADAFPDLMDYGFTAALEEDLDEIAEAKDDWKAVLDRFYKGFTKQIAASAETMRGNEPVLTPIACTVCGRPMSIRTGRTGVFLGCTGYSLPPKERCTTTVNLVPGSEAAAVSDQDEETSEAEAKLLHEQKRCSICHTAMDAYLVDKTRKIHICGNNPDCAGVTIEAGSFQLKGYEGPSIPCDKCGKPMQLKLGRFGKYFGCTGYPECGNTRKLLRSGEAAPPKCPPVAMPELPCTKGPGHFVLRDGAAGLFLAASTYPKVRETRNPLVEDLVRHASELDPKYAFLATAPVVDSKGRKAIIRFDRKAKEQYVSSEDAKGEPSGWSARFDGRQWVAKQENKQEK
jgi:DNA topoisomerase-1